MLWAFYTSKRTLTQATPFFLIYVVKRMVLIEIMVPSARLVLISKLPYSSERTYDVATLQKKRGYLTKSRLIELITTFTNKLCLRISDA